jgi:cobalt-zinc-cadmium efflux system membrane fusion protein
MTNPQLPNDHVAATPVTAHVNDNHAPNTPTPVHKPHSSTASTVVVILALVGLGLFLLHHLGVPLPGLSTHESMELIPERVKATGVEFIKNADHSYSILVPDDVAEALGIRHAGMESVATAKEATARRPLVLSGSTALDPAKLWRVRIRFPSAQVIEMGKNRVKNDPRTDESPETEKTRELRPGDRVEKGELLMVLHSVDVGQKKNDLIDAQVQLKLDQEILDRANISPAVPEVFLLNAKRNVESDRNSLVRAENTLQTWGIPEKDIKAAHDEAERIGREGWRDRKRDMGPNSPWARVELLAPESGFIVERNVSLHETIVDNTLNLMQIAQVDRLLVVANAFEEELKSLNSLPTNELKWAIRTIDQSNHPIEPGEIANNDDSPALIGNIEDVGYLIDVNQRSAVLKGHIDNPRVDNGKKRRADQFLLRAGQYVTATILVPPPDYVVTIPIEAIVEDVRGQTLVFVQKKDVPERIYSLRRVKVLQRFDKFAYVASELAEKQKPLSAEDKALGYLPLQPLKVGDRVLTAGVLELKKEMEDKQNEG